jgi:hypothetical protein
MPLEAVPHCMQLQCSVTRVLELITELLPAEEWAEHLLVQHHLS